MKVPDRYVDLEKANNGWATLAPGVGQFAVTHSGYILVYIDNQSIGNDVWFDNVHVEHYTSKVLEEDMYYPFGLTLSQDAGVATTAQPYKYNSKELQTEFGLQYYDYGARMYNSQIGRWNGMDNKADLYKNISPYSYAANQPTNAIDPDGNLVIFVNGFTLSSSEQGTERYWRSYKTISTPTFNGVGQVYYQSHKVLDKAFDLAVSKQLGDNHRIYIHGGNNIFGGTRGLKGMAEGYRDAPAIIESLHRTNGVIDETIKFITHSMGGLYGDGYRYGLMRYISENPELKKQVKITLVADFDPFQARWITNNGKTKKQEFIHKGISISGGLANEKEQGDYEYYLSPKKSSHSILSFFDNIKDLHEGKYKWNDATQQWQLQKK